jgi:hypothetical protein
MAKTKRDLEEEKKQFEIYYNCEEFWKNRTNIVTCYGDVLIRCEKDNKPKTDEEREYLRSLLEDIYYQEDRNEILSKLGYTIELVAVYDTKDLPTTVPVHLRSTGEAAKEAERKAEEKNAEMWAYYQAEEYKARQGERESEGCRND